MNEENRLEIISKKILKLVDSDVIKDIKEIVTLCKNLNVDTIDRVEYENETNESDNQLVVRLKNGVYYIDDIENGKLTKVS